MFGKIDDYILMVVNLYFLVGIIAGFGCKALWGGQIVSLATGVCVGVLLYMVVQQYLLR